MATSSYKSAEAQVSQQAQQMRGRIWWLDPWSVSAVLIAIMILAPVASVLWMALNPSENIWPHLIATVMPRYLGNTLVLMLGTGLVTAVIGTSCAWIVAMHEFPGRKTLDVMLLFPMAIPAYIGAYALVDIMAYAGPIQSNLREIFGWSSARDYWFPRARSMEMAILVLSAALYPYVYLLARAAFREQSGSSYEVARALGAGPWALFFRLGLPLARPAIAVGVALVLMEVVADYGTVTHFNLQTLTTGIFSTWLNGGNAGGAAQIAGLALALIFGLVLIERQSRRRAAFHRPGRSTRPITRQDLTGASAWGATVFCSLPVVIGFVLPVGVMLWHAARAPGAWRAPGLGQALTNTVIVASIAAFATVTFAVILVYGLRLSGRMAARKLLPLTSLGYATPGAVLAVGLLIPLAALDHGLADLVLHVTGWDPGLLLTGTAFALGLAYVVRFFGIAQGAVDTAFERVTPSLPLAARLLGQGPKGALRYVYLPLMQGSVLTALLIVFVDCVKELPATLLLRPFNYNTLATRVFELSSLEKISDAAPAALLVMSLGLVAVFVMARGNRDV